MILRSDKTRMQTLNLADVMDKLRCYIREAEQPPPEVLPETLALIKKRYIKKLCYAFCYANLYVSYA